MGGIRDGYGCKSYFYEDVGSMEWVTTKSIDDYPANTWRLLSKDEWVYLLQTRKNAHKLRSLATVNEVNGLIILPDDWGPPNGIVFNASNSYLDNHYSIEEWSLMESAGAVFLPNLGDRGIYWSNTEKSYRAYYTLYFKEGKIIENYINSYDKWKCNIRLVNDLDGEYSIRNWKQEGNIRWSVVRDTLYIVGTGEIPDYQSVSEFEEEKSYFAANNNMPWASYKNKITRVEIGEGITSIGNASFQDFVNLRTCTLPKSISRIGYGAFCGCKQLRTINLNIVDSIIEGYAFYGCQSVWKCDTGAKIGDFAFAGSGLSFLHIGSQDIGKKAFWRCDLSWIRIYSLEPPHLLDSNPFGGVERKEKIELTIRKGTRKFYKTFPWNKMKIKVIDY